MYAAKYGKPEMLTYLIEQGADPKRTINRKSALYYARKFNKSEIVKRLTSYEPN